MSEQLAKGVTLHCGDCLDVLVTLPENSIDSCVTDPPYHLTADKKGGSGIASLNENSPAGRSRISTGFMGKSWDGGDIAFRPDVWREVLRVLKPGGHLLAFGGTRTYHRMVCAIEDAGFEIRDQIQWIYGSGFPKSLDVSKAIDRGAGAEREVVGFDQSKFRPNRDKHLLADQPGGGGKLKADNGATITAPATDAARAWEGWGTALKPSHEPIVLARKPLSESTVAANVLRWGTGALNIDGCRVEIDPLVDDARLGGKGDWSTAKMAKNVYEGGYAGIRTGSSEKGRWPANIIHDGSEEVVEGFPDAPGQQRSVGPANGAKPSINVYGDYGPRDQFESRGDSGSAARFFYQVKPDTKGRWPANVITDGSEEVIDLFPDSKSCDSPSSARCEGSIFGGSRTQGAIYPGEHGSAARFFYSPKADSDDRLGSRHPTIKPVDLKAYLVRLITPPGGLVLDCFAGTGTTGEAAWREGMRAILIERELEYCDDIRRRMKLVMASARERVQESVKTRGKDKRVEELPLFGGFLGEF